MLTPGDFDAFFEAVHEVGPFPWQSRLARHVIERGRWPPVLDLPTGAGKTAAMDVALFHLALELERGAARRAPMRIAFVVDRRLVVDDAFARARKLERALESADVGVVARVASALRVHVEAHAPPLIARALRGGIPREDDWARTPGQPTILCSTVDQVGSRLLFRGYGVSDSMKPIHAGLLGADCLLLLDEAHIAEPFRQTLEWVQIYRGPAWREVDDARPWGVALLTATPGSDAEEPFGLAEDDYAHPVLRRRLDAAKPARLIRVARRGARTASVVSDADTETRELANRVDALVAETAASLEHFSDPAHGATIPAIAVVVNRVARARAVFERLRAELDGADVWLLIGPTREVDRQEVEKALAPIRTGTERALDRPLVIVSTQCVEVGVDIDLDGLITEVAPLDSLRQRFGRLNRDGRGISPFAAILAWKSELSGRYDDPVYGKALRVAWDRLEAAAVEVNSHDVVDFGIGAFRVPLEDDALSWKEDAPVLLPGYLDLLGQTSPIPAADPDVGLFLHGVRHEPDAVTVVWRADIDVQTWLRRRTPVVGDSESDRRTRRLLMLVPPRAGEAISLPIWAVRRWLRTGGRSQVGELADAATVPPDEDDGGGAGARSAFRWKGDDDRSQWSWPSQIRPGDTVVVPCWYGGVDAFGWNPGLRDEATDVGARAALAFAARRFAVRVAPGLCGEPPDDAGAVRRSADALAEALAGAESRRWEDLRTAVLSLELPAELKEHLERLEAARKERVISYLDVYACDADGRPRGVVFLAPRGVTGAEAAGGATTTTEDDLAGSLTGLPVALEEHCRGVAERAAQYARAANLPDPRPLDLEIAGLLHDIGKADPRFQAWLHYGDPLGPDPTDASSVLAKSGRELPLTARSATALPDRWRHEAFSVRLAPYAPDFARANDPELVLWLIGSHHGHGRTFFPHEDAEDSKPRAMPQVLDLPDEIPAGPGPQSLGFTWNGADWPALRDRVSARYGIWELALMEAVLRLADHRTSEKESSRT